MEPAVQSHSSTISKKSFRCPKAEEEFRALSNKYPGITFTHLDCDQSLLGKRFYGVQSEPEVVLCTLGTEVTRHTGVNNTLLEKKLQKYSLQTIVVIIFRMLDVYKLTPFPVGTEKYEPFDTRFRREYEEVYADLDWWIH